MNMGLLMCQFLIGTVLHDIHIGGTEYRGRTVCQFLIGTVLQQCFRCFPTTVFFFRLKYLQKVCRPHFFIIANLLEKSSFFVKNIFSYR